MLSDGHFCVWWSLFLETTRVLVVEPVVINWEENNFIIYQDLPRWSIFQLSCSHQHNPRSMLTKQWGVLFHQTEGQKQKSNKNCGLGNTALPPCYWQRTCTNSVRIGNQDITKLKLGEGYFLNWPETSLPGHQEAHLKAFENCGISLQWETIWKLLNNLWNVKLSQKRFSWKGH